MKPPTDLRQLFCFGDSSTAGESDIEHAGWVARLSSSAIKRNHQSNNTCQSKDESTSPAILDCRVYGLGVGGETVDGLLVRFESEYLYRKINNSRRLVILQYGINDIVIHKNKNKVPVDIFKSKLTKVIQFCLKDKVSVALLELQSIATPQQNHALNEGNDGKGVTGEGVTGEDSVRASSVRRMQDVDLYNRALQELKHLYPIEVYRWQDIMSYSNITEARELLASDGYHLNSKGHKALANYLENCVGIFDSNS
ncbi:MAG: hypothetical protein HWE27_06650 [Gammaproteobacteria bacterium]|nr:hypothetical protein [Gammaproteobacteria bacterium]